MARPGPGAPRRFVEDLSGYRYMPGVRCPRCGADACRQFGALHGSFTPRHAVRCVKRCGFEVLVVGRVHPDASESTSRAGVVVAFQRILNRAAAEGLREVHIGDE